MDQIVYDMEKYFSPFFFWLQEKLQFAKHLNKSYRRLENFFAKLENNFSVWAALTYLKLFFD